MFRRQGRACCRLFRDSSILFSYTPSSLPGSGDHQLRSPRHFGTGVMAVYLCVQTAAHTAEGWRAIRNQGTMVTVTAIAGIEERLKKPPFSPTAPMFQQARQQSQLFPRHSFLPPESAAARRSEGIKILPSVATGKPLHWGRSRSSSALG